jgi:hypothetical protein
MTHLGLLKDLQPKLVLGDNIAQTYQFVMTQNAPIGFVALSQVFINGKIGTGSAWVVPSHYYKPLRQEVILLKNAQDHSAAKALMLYLRGEKAKAVMKSFGYLTERKPSTAGKFNLFIMDSAVFSNACHHQAHFSEINLSMFKPKFLRAFIL